jgi:hypothetical protein
MNHHIDIQNELNELNSSLALLRKQPVFNVPDGYFENFAGSVLLRIKQEQSFSPSEELGSLSSLLSGISKKMPYSVPENYFTTLDNELPALLKEEVLPDELSVLKKKVPYEVPTAYFDTLPQQILSKVTGKKQQAKVVSFGRKFVRYAVAAVVITVFATVGIVYLNKEKEQPVYTAHVDVQTMLKDVSDSEIADFISVTNAVTSENGKSATYENVEVSTLLQDIPSSELDEFLDQVAIQNEVKSNENNKSGSEDENESGELNSFGWTH